MSGKTIIIANRGLMFDGATIRRGPSGGVESATVFLAEALARAGHRVSVYNNRDTVDSIAGVTWRPLSHGLPLRADLYIANRNHELCRGQLAQEVAASQGGGGFDLINF